MIIKILILISILIVIFIISRARKRKIIEKLIQSEGALIQSENNYRKLVDNSLVGVFRSNLTGEILFLNEAAARIFEYDTLREMEETKIILNYQDPRQRNLLLENLKKNGTVENYEVEVITKKNNQRVILLNVILEGNELSGMFLNITDRKNMEKSLLKSYEEMESRVRARTMELSIANEKLLIYQEQLKSLGYQLSLAEEKQRRVIAAKIHDHIGQILAGIKIKLGLLKDEVEGISQKEQIVSIQSLVQKSLQVSRNLLFDLSPPVLYELGLVPAIEWLIEQYQKAHSLKITCQEEGEPQTIDDELRFFIFQTIRELLLNITKHARATEASINLHTLKETIRIKIRDNGIGFKYEPDKLKDFSQGGYGLFNIRERMGNLGGLFEINSLINSGTEVILTVPIYNKRK